MKHLLVLVAIFLSLVICPGSQAQWDTSWQKQYPVGAKVVCSPVGDDSDWREGVVTESYPGAGMIKVRVGPGKAPNRYAGVFTISSDKTIRLAGAQSTAGPSAPVANSGGTDRPGQTGAEHNSAGNAGSSFQVGETVLASPSYNNWDWRKGVVVDNDPNASFMRINVEAGNGFAGGVYMVSRSAVKKFSSLPSSSAATAHGIAKQPAVSADVIQAAPAQQQNVIGNPLTTTNQPGKHCCPPQQSLEGNSLEAVFKREIRDRYIVDGRSISATKFPSTITFHSFSMSGPRPYKMPEPWAYHTGSPDGPGGTIGTQVYDIKTKYTVCEDEQPDPKYGYKGYVNFVDADVTYVGLRNSKTGAWQVNQSGGTVSNRSEKK